MLEEMAHTGSGRRTERTCVGCRQKDVPDALLRFAVGPEAPHLAPDVSRRLGGRGVSVHPRRACIEAAVRRGGLARSLRRPVPVSAEVLAEMAAEQYRRRAEGLLLSAHRGGHAAVGTDAVREAMGRGQARMLVVAADAANRRDELEALAARLGGRCVVLSTKERLGRLLGREEVGVVAVKEPGIADELGLAADRARLLTEDE